MVCVVIVGCSVSGPVCDVVCCVAAIVICLLCLYVKVESETSQIKANDRVHTCPPKFRALPKKKSRKKAVLHGGGKGSPLTLRDGSDFQVHNSDTKTKRQCGTEVLSGQGKTDAAQRMS